MSKLRTLVCVALATVAASLAAAAPAQAGHWWMWGSNIFHIHKPHNPAFPFFNWADEHGDMRTRCEYARGLWSANANIDMYGVGSFHEAQITCEDGYWGRTDWLGLAVHEGPYEDWAGHYGRMRALNNLSYLNADYNSWQWRQAVACQEVGHGLGMLHQGPGCMGVGYGTDAYASGAREPSGHDHEHVSWLYGGLH